jgi:hypothetical protein
VVQVEKESLESQVELLTAKNERNTETFRREERLLLSTMYEIKVNGLEYLLKPLRQNL